MLLQKCRAVKYGIGCKLRLGRHRTRADTFLSFFDIAAELVKQVAQSARSPTSVRGMAPRDARADFVNRLSGLHDYIIHDLLYTHDVDVYQSFSGN